MVERWQRSNLVNRIKPSKGFRGRGKTDEGLHVVARIGGCNSAGGLKKWERWRDKRMIGKKSISSEGKAPMWPRTRRVCSRLNKVFGLCLSSACMFSQLERPAATVGPDLSVSL